MRTGGVAVKPPHWKVCILHNAFTSFHAAGPSGSGVLGVALDRLDAETVGSTVA
jgi:hypothetical protein